MFHIDLLKYLSDQTIPDGLQVRRDEGLPDKIWIIRNSGTTTWNAGYTLIHHAGERFGAEGSTPLPPLQPGEIGQVVVRNLVAPRTLGTYYAEWIAQAPGGERFGSPLTIEITVVED